jgi:hypothetical protein
MLSKNVTRISDQGDQGFGMIRVAGTDLIAKMQRIPYSQGDGYSRNAVVVKPTALQIILQVRDLAEARRVETPASINPHL